MTTQHLLPNGSFTTVSLARVSLPWWSLLCLNFIGRIRLEHGRSNAPLLPRASFQGGERPGPGLGAPSPQFTFPTSRSPTLKRRYSLTAVYNAKHGTNRGRLGVKNFCSVVILLSVALCCRCKNRFASRRCPGRGIVISHQQVPRGDDDTNAVLSVMIAIGTKHRFKNLLHCAFVVRQYHAVVRVTGFDF